METAVVGRDEAILGLEHEIGRLVRRIRRGLVERAAQVAPELGPTAYTLLVTLAEFGPQRAADLSDMFALDKGAVSRIVRQLLDLGLIEKSPDPSDGRASILEVTDKARRRFEAMAEKRREDFGARLAGWEPDEIAGLAASLERLNGTVSD